MQSFGLFFISFLVLEQLRSGVIVAFTPAFSISARSSTSARQQTAGDEGVDATMFQNVKGVLFDVDGTLADSWKLGFDATQKVLENHEIPLITEHMYHEHTVYTTPNRLARHAGLQPSDADFEKVGIQLGQEFDDMYVDLVSMETAAFFPGVADMLSNLPKDVKLGALTNACVKYAEAVLRVNSAHEKDMDFDFGSVHGADDVPAAKPAPDGLYLLCKELDVDPSECVYIGDSPSDARAAENAGMPSIGVLWGSHSEESLRKAPFTIYCKSVEELQALLPKSLVETS